MIKRLHPTSKFITYHQGFFLLPCKYALEARTSRPKHDDDDDDCKSTMSQSAQ